MGEAAKRDIKHGAHQDSENPAAELVVDVELDVAEPLAGRVEGPAIFEVAEWSFEVFDQDLQVGPVERHPAGKRLAHQLVGDRHVRDDNLDALWLLSSPPH